MRKLYSRRAVLGQVGFDGAAAAWFPFASVAHAFEQADNEPWYFLKDAEANWLAAACGTLIPEDDFPSASQARSGRPYQLSVGTRDNDAMNMMSTIAEKMTEEDLRAVSEYFARVQEMEPDAQKEGGAQDRGQAD